MRPDLTGAPAELIVVAGDGQSGSVGDVAADSLAVQLVDAGGRAVAGAVIRWTSTSAELSPGISATNRVGIARSRVRIGTASGNGEVLATFRDLEPAVIRHYAHPGAADRVVVVDGNGQSATVATALANPIRARVLDRFGNPAPDAAVTWNAASGSLLEAQSTSSDSVGYVSARWVLGGTGGEQRTWVHLPQGDSAGFTATARPAAIAEISIEPEVASFEVAELRRFRVHGADAFGNVVVVGSPTWSASDTSLVELHPGGTVRGVREGSLELTATSSGINTTARLVIVPSVVAGVAVAPNRVILPVGDSIALRSSPLAADGSALDSRWFDWSSSGPSVALRHVSGAPAAVAYAEVEGTAAVTAFTAGHEGTAVIEVRQPRNAKFRSIAAGAALSCALTFDDRPYCWGSRDSAQIVGEEPTGSTSPEPLLGAPAFVSMSVGTFSACGLDRNGGAYCWGDGGSGRLGGGTSEDSPVPVPVEGGRAYVQLAVGHDHACALTAAGQAYCWGENSVGQLGTGTLDGALTPVPVDAGPFVEISASYRFTCAVAASGLAECWGVNDLGQLGTGDKVDRARSGPVLSNATFARIVTGVAHACGLTVSGQAYCWGNNQFGQLGDGTRDERTRAEPVITPVALASLSSRGAHTCGLSPNGEAYCWGWGEAGQLGSGAKVVAERPVRVSSPGPLASIAVGGIHTCATTAEGGAYCWGDNTYGQLGDLTRTERLTPVSVLVYR